MKVKVTLTQDQLKLLAEAVDFYENFRKPDFSEEEVRTMQHMVTVFDNLASFNGVEE